MSGPATPHCDVTAAGRGVVLLVVTGRGVVLLVVTGRDVVLLVVRLGCPPKIKPGTGGAAVVAVVFGGGRSASSSKQQTCRWLRQKPQGCTQLGSFPPGACVSCGQLVACRQRPWRPSDDSQTSLRPNVTDERDSAVVTCRLDRPRKMKPSMVIAGAEAEVVVFGGGVSKQQTSSWLRQKPQDCTQLGSWPPVSCGQKEACRQRPWRPSDDLQASRSMPNEMADGERCAVTLLATSALHVIARRKIPMISLILTHTAAPLTSLAPGRLPGAAPSDSLFPNHRKPALLPSGGASVVRQ